MNKMCVEWDMRVGVGKNLISSLKYNKVCQVGSKDAYLKEKDHPVTDRQVVA